MKRCMVVCLLFVVCIAKAQDIKQKLDEQVRLFVADSQMRAGILGFYVADATTGEEIFNWNGKMGLPAASTQKVITSVAAFDLLGKDYRYKTEFWGRDIVSITRNGKKHNAMKHLFIKGYGDPTLGSWRYTSTTEDAIADSLAAGFASNNVQELSDGTNSIYLYQNGFDILTTPGGWIVDDIGNYYGAGASAVNWKENQFDVKLFPGKNEGDPVGIAPDLLEKSGYRVRYNLLKTGKKGSGDNAYIYFDQQGYMILAGTAESSTGTLTISGAAVLMINLSSRLTELLRSRMQIPYDLRAEMRHDSSRFDLIKDDNNSIQPKTLLYTHYSPSLDSIVYWFMKRSINLYGEALAKTIAFEKTGVGSTDSGVAVMRRFYKDKGFDIASLKIKDGSGLSPQNRVTAEALCKVLLYAKGQSWFPYFLQAFPRYNNMNLKSGTIGGVKSYTGYHTAADGKQYVVAIIVNNFEGTAGAIEKKMFKVLDVLK
jgi:serine-type D-Ala-D-Ala carboxypeptidase/endopeptidase (penicillin-binding protein 4)